MLQSDLGSAIKKPDGEIDIKPLISGFASSANSPKNNFRSFF